MDNHFHLLVKMLPETDFSDSGIIGTKVFVSKNYRKFKHFFHSKKEKIPKRISGLDGVYSLKRLAE
jgi:putative transposase